MTKWITIMLCLVGLGMGAYVVATSGQKPPSPPPAAAPSVNPFVDGIAASGTVEAASRNIALAAPVGGLVTDVLVEVNDQVKRGQELFKLDTRELDAQLTKLSAAVAVAEAELAKLKAQPREEDLPPLRAAVERARARLADVEDWHETLLKAHSNEAISSTEVTRSHFAVVTTRAELAAAEAALKQAEAGAWAPDLHIAEANLNQARADVDSVKILLDRMVVRSPIDGTILKRNVDPGRFAMADPNQAAVVVGDMSAINIRAQVDEEDTPRLHDHAKAVARVRGASEKMLPLTMVRIEPLAAPKMSLTGSLVERVDTRVVEVVFRVESLEGMTLYPGQVVDVYVESKAKPGDQAAGDR